jgi:hypothetical protein
VRNERFKLQDLLGETVDAITKIPNIFLADGESRSLLVPSKRHKDLRAVL